VLDPDGFAMSLPAMNVGAVSVGVLAYAAEVRLETAYEVNVPLDGPLGTWTGRADVCATPSLAAVYRADGRTRLHGWTGGERLWWPSCRRAACRRRRWPSTRMNRSTCASAGSSTPASPGPGAGDAADDAPRADELVDGFSGGRADLVAEYAVPFVQTVISAIIGFPREDTEQIQAWTGDVNTLWNVLAPVEARVASARRMADDARYLQALIDGRRAHPREDLISDLVHGANGHPGLPDEYIHDIVRGAAHVAGFDTTRDAITATVLVILQNPEGRERVLADAARTIPKVTEEALRRDAPHRGLFRITTRDTHLGGADLPVGTPLLLLFGSGNRDETKFPNPDAVDLDRPNVRDHLAFGRGLHVCPGAPMARAEIRVALEALIHRLPRMRLADGHEPVYIASYFFRGLESLHVTW
jgi:hypothetical protein